MTKHRKGAAGMETRANSPTSSRTLWILAGLIILGLLVRAPRLAESLWYDEIAAWLDYGQYGPAWIVTHFYDPANHIGHTLASWATHSLLGEIIGEGLALRLPALLFSLGSIPAIWGTTNCALRQKNGDRPLFRDGEIKQKGPVPIFGRRVAIVAALLATVLPVSVLEGAEARGYSMMICFAALMTWILLSALKDERWTKWLLYAAVCPLGIWAHMMTVWIPIGHAAWLTWKLLRSRQRGFALRGLATIALAAGLTLLLYWPVLDDILRIRGEFIIAEGDEPSVFGTEGLHTLLQMGGAWYWWAAAPGLVAVTVGLAALWEGAKPRAAVGAALVGLPIMVIALCLAGSWMYARFALFALPGAVFLMSVGIDRLWRWKQIAGLGLLSVIIVCSGLELGLRPPRQPLREAAAFVRDRSHGDDALVIVGLRHPVMDVYASDLQREHSLFLGRDLVAQLDADTPRWVIVMYPRSVQPVLYEAMRQRGYRVTERFDGWIDWGNGVLEVWERAEP